MKNMKSFFAVLLAVLLVLSVTACSTDDKKTEAPTTAAPTEAEKTDAPTTAAPTEAEKTDAPDPVAGALHVSGCFLSNDCGTITFTDDQGQESEVFAFDDLSYVGYLCTSPLLVIPHTRPITADEELQVKKLMLEDYGLMSIALAVYSKGVAEEDLYAYTDACSDSTKDMEDPAAILKFYLDKATEMYPSVDILNALNVKDADAFISKTLENLTMPTEILESFEIIDGDKNLGQLKKDELTALLEEKAAAVFEGCEPLPSGERIDLSSLKLGQKYLATASDSIIDVFNNTGKYVRYTSTDASQYTNEAVFPKFVLDAGMPVTSLSFFEDTALLFEEVTAEDYLAYYDGVSALFADFADGREHPVEGSFYTNNLASPIILTLDGGQSFTLQPGDVIDIFSAGTFSYTIAK